MFGMFTNGVNSKSLKDEMACSVGGNNQINYWSKIKKRGWSTEMN